MSKDSNKVLLTLGMVFLVVITLILSVYTITNLNNFSKTLNDNLVNGFDSDLSIGGSVNVFIQDQTTPIVDLYMHSEEESGQLLVMGAVRDNDWIILPLNSSVAVDDIICLKELVRFYQAKVLAVNTIVGVGINVSLDTPLDYSFSTIAFVCVGSNNMAVDGSTETQIFKISPKGLSEGTQWDIVRVLIHIDDNVAMDTETFGGISSLTNGIVLRKKDGEYNNIFNIKSNGEFAERAYDITYDDKAPAGLFSIRVRRTFGGQSKNGVTIRLDADSDDELQLLVRDDLSALDHVHVVVQGHVVD